MRPRKKITQLITGLLLGGAMDPAQAQDAYVRERERMVTTQIEARGVRDPRVLAAMRKVPRHLFVPANAQADAHYDGPLPIGHEQTISQPFIVASMSEALELRGNEKVLEIGTGSGYQAAVLAELAAQVYSIEIVQPLAEQSDQLLKKLGYTNITVRHGDGYKGWPEAAPFDAIIVTAAPPEIPQALIDQLKLGGRMVIPVGGGEQHLLRITKTPQGIQKEHLYPVRFVPMIKER
jgi:protein-L-isoaspartate(D-aspartate) O-methyltransferase